MARSTPSATALLAFAAAVGSIALPALGQLGAARPVKDDIFYQIMPIAWRDSNNDAQRFGDFDGLTASLDYLQGLGVTALYINPIFPTNAYHGYQHGDATLLNSRFGTEAQFLNFVNAAHARSMKVFLDIVVYGVSTNVSSPWFTSAHNNPSSPYDLWLGFTNSSNSQWTGSSYSTWNGQTVGFIQWNLANSGAVGVVEGWARKWIDPNNDGNTADGVDGFRLDHVYSSAPEGWGATSTFWAAWEAYLKAIKPDIFNFAEQGDWGNYGTDILGFLDSCVTIPYMFSARTALTDESGSELASAMASTLAALPSSDRVMLLTLGNHDVPRLSTAMSDNAGRLKAAAAVQMTGPLPPVIYYGDELGMRGQKNNSYSGDATDIPQREPFKWNSVAGAPMSNYFVLNSAAYNGRVERDNDGRSVQEQQGVAGSLLETYRSLIAVRTGSVALRRGTYTNITPSNSRFDAFLRSDPSQTVMVVINPSSASQSGTLNLSSFSLPSGDTTPVSLENGSTLTAITSANKSAYPITLPAYSWVIVSAALTPPQPPPPPPSNLDGLNLPTDAGAGFLAATQNNLSSYADNTGELDQLYVHASGDFLRVSISGNLPTDGTAMAVFIQHNTSTTALGQNILATSGIAAPPSGISQLTGLRFDTGFAPDNMYWINAPGSTFYVDHVFLPGAGLGSSSKTYVGQGTVNSGLSSLSGGTNTAGMAASFNNTNTAGITASSVANASTATKGFELWIPFSDIGLPSGFHGNVGVAVGIVQSSGAVVNQWLPGLGGGLANPGLAPNFNLIAGTQYAVVPIVMQGDLNGDCVCNTLDLGTILSSFGQSATANTGGDLNGDGVVNSLDLGALLSVFGTSCP